MRKFGAYIKMVRVIHRHWHRKIGFLRLVAFLYDAVKGSMACDEEDARTEWK